MSSTKRTPEHPRLYVSAAVAVAEAAAAAEAVEAAHMPVAAAAEVEEAALVPAAEVVAEVEEAALVPAAEVVAEAEAAPPMPAVAEDVATTTVAAEAAAAAAEAAEVASGFGGAAVAAVAVEAIGAGGQATVGPGAIDLACRRAAGKREGVSVLPVFLDRADRSRRLQPSPPSKAGSLAIFAAMRRASSSISPFAIAASRGSAKNDCLQRVFS
jgi:hypothetical protein